jgi:membrane associated rhomboid family serine protease/Zn-finger nucleic acid-binding protein
MAAVPTILGKHRLDLDVCPSCQAVWLDRAEFDAIPKGPSPASPAPVASAAVDLSEAARQEAAIMEVQSHAAAESEEVAADASPGDWWHWVPGVLGMPVEEAAPVRRERPWLTWSVAAFLVLVFLVTSGSREELVRQWGFVPAEWGRHGGLTFVTSFFIHAGLFHLLSNLYFFLVFGDNVEDHLGPLLFLLLLGAAQVVGLLLHAAYEPRADLPCIGASAGISGVLAYYAVVFPRARLAFLWFFFVWVRVPAITALILFAILQLVGSLMQASGAVGVSYLAHLGGLTVGIAIGVAARWTKGPEEGAAATT